MGGCFSKQNNGDDDMIARLMSNPEYMENLSGLDKARYERMTTPTPTQRPTQRPTPTQKQNATTFIDPNCSFDYPQHVLAAMQNKTRTLCHFGAGCTRKSSMHVREFSHDPQNNNGTVGSREACCKAYQEETSQTSLGGGCVGGIRYRQPPAGQELDESLVTHAGCAFLTSDRRIAMVSESASNKWNFPCGDRNPGETSMACAVRETREELGFDPFVNKCVTRKSTFVKTHVSKRTGKRTQTAIYVFQHDYHSSWFNQYFRQNNECSAIVVIPIEDFQYYVRNNANLFRFPESMAEFAAKML